MEINNVNEYRLSFEDFVPRPKNITNSEIDFVREYLWKLKIDVDDDYQKILITTDGSEFSYFLTNVIRSYNTRHSK